MPPLTVHWTTTLPNPRKDINPSLTVVVVSYTTPWNARRYSIFGDNEDWRRILPIIVDRDMKLWNRLPKTIEG